MLASASLGSGNQASRPSYAKPGGAATASSHGTGRGQPPPNTGLPGAGGTVAAGSRAAPPTASGGGVGAAGRRSCPGTSVPARSRPGRRPPSRAGRRPGRWRPRWSGRTAALRARAVHDPARRLSAGLGRAPHSGRDRTVTAVARAHSTGTAVAERDAVAVRSCDVRITSARPGAGGRTRGPAAARGTPRGATPPARSLGDPGRRVGWGESVERRPGQGAGTTLPAGRAGGQGS